MTEEQFAERARTILRNLAKENPGPWSRVICGRWFIHHEPLRADARNLLSEYNKGREAPPYEI